mgnify:FL=1
MTMMMTSTTYKQKCLFNAALATVVTPSEVPGEAVIESDNDGIAYVVNPDKLTRFETNNPGQRIFYTYINAANPTGDASKKGTFYFYRLLAEDLNQTNGYTKRKR